MNLDIHNHVLPAASLELLRAHPVYGATVTDTEFSGGNHSAFWLDPAFYNPDEKVAQLEAKGLDGAILSAAPPLFFYDLGADPSERIARVTNLGLAGFAAAYPDRLRWMATLPMGAPERVVPILKDAVDAGAIGVEVGTCIAGRRLDEETYAAFWAAAEELQTPVLLHPAFNETHRGLEPYYFQNVIGNQLETTVTIERLIASGVLTRHPDLRIVLVHGGGYFPFQAGRFKHARTVRPELKDAPSDPWSFFGQVVVDTLTHDAETLRHLISRVGRANVLMGTDSPFDMSTPEPMKMLREVADDETVRAIAEENIARVYRLTAPAAVS
jgi:aminocarboxymuconate-semialdehyde decarboxylase